MRKVTVNVTQSHIVHGSRNDPKACAVYLACRDAGLRIHDASPAGLSFRGLLDSGGEERKFWHSNFRQMEDWMLAFDRGAGVAPFRFQVEVPEECLAA